jgi:hypothetical protein
MAYLLAGTSIRSPAQLKETNSTQMAQQRVLSGAISRDYFGSNKRVWVLDYTNTKKADYDTINTIYLSYLSTATAQSWQITETNYAVSATTVHVDLQERGFSAKGTDYISDFSLILTEA